MQISGITTSTTIPVQRTATSSSEVNSASDQAVLNTSADSFSSLVKAASQMPEVRSDVVETYKSRIKAGHYPSEDIIAGLTRLIGGGIMQSAKKSSSSQGA